MTQAELDFLTRIPHILKDIEGELRAINETLKGLKEAKDGAPGTDNA